MSESHVQGTIYLLHFDTPFGHAAHYLGWASNLDMRLRHHSKGTGANLLRHVRNAGIGWIVSRTWSGDRYEERRLKNLGGHARKCPICQGVAPQYDVAPAQDTVRVPSEPHVYQAVFLRSA
jgi:predicted GIY-YIG superfamily endonuclease